MRPGQVIESIRVAGGYDKPLMTDGPGHDRLEALSIVPAGLALAVEFR